MAESTKKTANNEPIPNGGTNSTDEQGNATGAEMATLQAKLTEAEQQREQYLDLAQRTRAEFENYQKRMARDQATERRYAQAPLAADLLAPIDNLDRATVAAQQAGEKGPLVQGVTMVQSQLLDILRRHGITRMDVQGKPFDANLHEAVMQQPTVEYPPHTVMQVLEPGYMIHERVLRPARVIVSAQPELEAKS
jgi:molecular chaperone GrpE